MATLNENELLLQVFNDCREQIQGRNSFGGLRRRVEQSLARRGIRLTVNQFEALLLQVKVRVQQSANR